MVTRRRRRNRRSPWSAVLMCAGLGLVLTTLGIGLGRAGSFAAAARAEELPGPGAGSMDFLEGPIFGPASIETAPALGPYRVHPGANLQVDDFYIHIPAGAVEPLTAVMVLHGMGGAGQEFSELVRARCDAEHWVIIAPTFRYGDWRDPAVLTREATQHFPRINALLDRLPDLAELSVRPKTFMYGFSRGAQAAHRYAIAYPERVAGVAMMAAGSYTLPAADWSAGDGPRPLPFPYGVSNLHELFGQPFNAAAFQQVPFWIGVGGRDNYPDELPRQWDTYLGDDRVERAQRFAEWLQQSNVNARLRIFANTGHAPTTEVTAAAMDFFSSLR